MTTHIELDHVTKHFPGQAGGLNAVDDLSFTVQQGEFLGYAGPNGAGKSTSIKAMTGLLSVTSGRVRVRDMDPLKKRKQLARHIGVVFGQRSQLLWELSAKDFFVMIKALYRLSDADWNSRLQHLTDVLELEGYIDQPVRSLSLGQRMRCELTAALLPNPEILFLDEPTIGLDVDAKAAMRTTLRKLNQEEGTTVVLTTHDLSDIEALCSRLMVIDHGRLAYDGTVAELVSAYSPTATVEFHTSPSPAVNLDPTWTVQTNNSTLQVTFDRTQHKPASVIREVISQVEVVDLNILEPSVEDVIGNIYRSSRNR